MALIGDQVPGDLPILQRRRLAQTGQEQLKELMATLKALLDAAASLEASSLDEKAAEVQRLLQQYQAHSQALQATLLQCQQLEQQPPMPGDPSEEQVLQLQLTVEGLQQQLASKNQLIKSVIDRLRLLMDAFMLWDSHSRAHSSAQNR